MEISASRPHNITEPTLGWEPSTQSFSTFPIRRQLGATESPFSLQERGALSLDSYSNITLYPDYFGNSGFANHFSPFEDVLDEGWPANSMPICQYCFPIGPVAVPDLSQAALLNDIIRDTWRPSVTI